ncbi:MAG: hypothetical protein K0U98_11410 [Deltaproteobacteria bacterium]|nr:hypothetical protein [Deltaproteobacteria bacterium]
MTTLAALTDGSTTWFGSDSQSQMNGIRNRAPCRKWVQLGELWIGTSGFYRAILEFESSGLKYENLSSAITNESEARGFSLQVCRDLRDALANQEWNMEPDGPGPKSIGCSFCLAAAGWVWSVDSGLSPVLVQSEELCTNGSGWEIALGAGSTALSFNLPPREAVRVALEQAIYWDTGSGGSIFLYELTKAGVLEEVLPPSSTVAKGGLK